MNAHHPIATHDQWLTARKALLSQEKELTRLRDRIAQQRRSLPWRRLDKDYVFETAGGPRRLGELFEGRRQLVVQHFMLGPGWKQGCPSCSYMADHVAGALPHLGQRDVTFLAISRAPLAEIERFRARMGWSFKWVSSHGNDFNRDFGVSFSAEELERDGVYYNYEVREFPQTEAPGISVFWRGDDGEVFHTYSTYGRGVELMMGAYDFIDLTPKGRDEDALEHPMAWVRHHDRYEANEPAKSGCCGGKA